MLQITKIIRTGKCLSAFTVEWTQDLDFDPVLSLGA